MTHYQAIVIGAPNLKTIQTHDFGENAKEAEEFERQLMSTYGLHYMCIGDMTNHITIYYFRDYKGNLIL